MSLLTGFHVQDDSYTGPEIGAATFLDVGGWASAQHARERMCRLYFTGRPEPVEIATKALSWTRLGCRVVLANEPNLDQVEHFGGGPSDYAEWFAAVAAHAPGARLYYAGMSPGVPGWQDWYTDPAAQRAIASAAGLCVHAYGSPAQVVATVAWLAAEFPGKPLWLGEFNPGAGNVFDLEAYAAELSGLLDELARVPALEAATWFSWKWDQSPHLPSSVDAAGTAVARVLHEWTPPDVAQETAPPSASDSSPSPEVAKSEAIQTDRMLAPKESPMPTRDELVAHAQQAATANDYPADLFVRQVDQESGFDPDAVSPAGAVGIAQIVAKYHPDVDPTDPIASLDYAARWMGALLRQYGDVALALVHYNGGGGAVAQYQAGHPYAESVAYVDAIVGEAAVAQFGGALEAAGFAPDWVASACGPVALAGAAKLLGLTVDVADVLRSAPEFGWTPEAGMGGVNDFVRLCARWGVVATPIIPGAVQTTLWLGRPVVVSTSHHYYLAARASREDADLRVGNTGLARAGGAAWLSLDAIAALDGGINGLLALSRGAPVAAAPAAPAVARPSLVEATTSDFDGLWAATEHLDALEHHELAVSMQGRIAAIKETIARRDAA